MSKVADAFSLSKLPTTAMSTHAGASRFVFHGLLTAMIAIWGASLAVVKVSLESLPPLPIVMLRFWLAVLCVLPFVRRGLLADLRRSAIGGLAAGFALALGYILQALGMNETSTSLGGFFTGLIVLLVALGGFVFLGARVGRLSIIGLLIGLGGTVLLCWPDHGNLGANSPRGMALHIGSAASYAAHALLLSRFGRGAPVVAFSLWQLTFAAIGATIATILTGDAATVFEVEWSPALLLQIGYLGILASALGIAVQSRVQHHIPPTQVALLFALQPVFAAGTGFVVMGDRMGTLPLLGGGIVVLAIVLTSLDRRVT